MGPIAWTTVGLLFVVSLIRIVYDVDSPIFSVVGFVLAVLAGFLFIRYFVQFIKFSRRIKAIDARLCPHCLYDLTSSPTDGTCPECGKSYTRAQLRQFWLGKDASQS